MGQYDEQQAAWQRQQEYLRQMERMQQEQQRQALEAQQAANAPKAYATGGYGNAIGTSGYGGFEAAEQQRQADRQALQSSQTAQSFGRMQSDSWRDREMKLPEAEVNNRNNQAMGQIAANERMNKYKADASMNIANSMGQAFGGASGGGQQQPPSVGLYDNAGRKIGGSFGPIGRSLLG